MSHPISLAHLSLSELSPVELIEVARRAEFDAVGLRLTLDGARDGALLRTIRRHAAAAEMRVLDVEVSEVDSDSRLGTASALLEAAACLGAPYVVVNGHDNDAERTTDRFAELCRQAEPLGVRPVLEFAPTTAIRTLSEARRVVESSTGGVLVDVLHLYRSGGDGVDLIAVDAERLPYLEMCDGPLRPPVGNDGALAAEAGHARLPPGRGEFPLVRVLDGCPLSDFPVSVKAPSAKLRARHGDLAFARLLRTSTASVLESHARKRPVPLPDMTVEGKTPDRGRRRRSVRPDALRPRPLRLA